MKKSAKIILSVVVLLIWSYLTLFISKEVRIEGCLDAGGSWDQAQNECIYIGKDSILFYIKRYEEKHIDADKLLAEITYDLRKQFNIEISDASLFLHAYNVLS
ncbi:MAG: hypothetical protein JRE40_16400 [Deltaproteobacteria bacterium]|nr:hypothetical protein [Deltaproteobacteria bacterium]